MECLGILHELNRIQHQNAALHRTHEIAMAPETLAQLLLSQPCPEPLVFQDCSQTFLSLGIE